MKINILTGDIHMELNELTRNIDVESAKLAKCEMDFEKARAALLSELERDALRGPGSDAQERRREEHQQDLRKAERLAEQALNEQRKVVTELKRQYELLPKK